MKAEKIRRGFRRIGVVGGLLAGAPLLIQAVREFNYGHLDIAGMWVIGAVINGGLVWGVIRVVGWIISRFVDD